MAEPRALLAWARAPFWNSPERRLRAFWRILGQQLVQQAIAVSSIAALMAAAQGDRLFTAGAPRLAVFSALQLLAVLVSVTLACRLLDRRRFRDLGLRLCRAWWEDFGFGLALGALLMTGIFLTERAAGWLAVTGFFAGVPHGRPFALALAPSLVLFLCAGFYEEVSDRGYVLRNLAEGLRFPAFDAQGALVAASLLSACLFGLQHARNPNVTALGIANIAAAGVLLSLGYLLTGRLGLSIGLHLSWNVCEASVYGFPVSGITELTATVVAIRQQGPALWTGGAFGPEAGLLGLAAIAGGSVLILGWVRVRYGRVSLCVALADPPVRAPAGSPPPAPCAEASASVSPAPGDRGAGLGQNQASLPGGDQMMRWLVLCFGLTAPVSRRTYALVGFGLMAFKFAVETVTIHAVTGNWLMPWDYLNPLLTSRQAAIKGADWLLWPLVVWTLPFLWVGVVMTLRRLVDAGASPFLALLYFVPGVNYLLMLALCALGTHPREGAWRPDTPPPVVDARLRSAALGVALGLTIALGMVAVSVFAFGLYGTTLFFATPVVMGAASAYVYNAGHARGVGDTIVVALVTMLMAGGSLLIFALEGVLCLLMASPIILGMGVMGALLGRAIALHGPTRAAELAGIIAVLPLLAGAESARPEPGLSEITTAIEIDAPPERVWPHVIGFSELPAPPSWVFRAGIAYPMRAGISGRGVGALRRCEFSTGAFVEPITVWDEPVRLAFDVAAQPPAMTEWSPYRHLSAPHLDGYMRSRRGEFRLTRLPGDRTRLEGTTWYQIEIFPAAYWHLWSDLLLHAIHQRVLDHIRRLALAS